MNAAVFTSVRTAPGSFLQIKNAPRPQPEGGHVLLKVVACGVCRTDPHIVEGYLPALRPQLIPGHQIVGEVDARDFLKIAHDLNIRPQVTVFPLEDANQALVSGKEETGHGSAVIPL